MGGRRLQLPTAIVAGVLAQGSVIGDTVPLSEAGGRGCEVACFGVAYGARWSWPNPRLQSIGGAQRVGSAFHGAPGVVLHAARWPGSHSRRPCRARQSGHFRPRAGAGQALLHGEEVRAPACAEAHLGACEIPGEASGARETDVH